MHLLVNSKSGLSSVDVPCADDVSDPELTERQRSILEFPGQWFNDPPQPDRQDYAGRPWLTNKHPDAEAELAGPSPLREGWSGPEILGYSWGAHKSNNEAQHNSKLAKLKKVVDNPRSPAAKL